MAWQPITGLGLYTVEVSKSHSDTSHSVSRSHSDTSHSVSRSHSDTQHYISRLPLDSSHTLELLRKRNLPITETSTWPQTTLTTDRQTDMYPAGFELGITANVRPQAHASDSTVTGFAIVDKHNRQIYSTNRCWKFKPNNETHNQQMHIQTNKFTVL